MIIKSIYGTLAWTYRLEMEVLNQRKKATAWHHEQNGHMFSVGWVWVQRQATSGKASSLSVSLGNIYALHILYTLPHKCAHTHTYRHT